MKILMNNKLDTTARAPANSTQEVILKIQDDCYDNWYVIRSVPGYHVDDSKIEQTDTILYRHPEAVETNGFFVGEQIPSGYTFVSSRQCKEVKEIRNNKDALFILDKEW